ncbi:hypothetical protein Q7P37_002372 [Cladosporium fusiforme]
MSREDEDAGPTLLAVAIVMLILVLITTTLRLTVRIKRSALGRDDYTIAAASLLTIGRVTCQFISVQHGNGRHREFLSVQNYQRINFLTWLTQLFLFPILCLLKLSVCFLVLRIKNTRPLRYGLWALIVLLVLSTLLPEIVLLAECDPFEAYWTGQHEKCWNPKVRIYSIYLQTAVSVFADIVCTLLPIAVVWHLTLTLKNKIAVCALMSLGVISTAFACVRASSLGLKVDDLSWAYCWAAIWGNLELGFGILGANLALARTYYDVFKRGFDSLTTKTRSQQNNTTNNTNTHKSSNTSTSNPKQTPSAYALSFLSSKHTHNHSHNKSPNLTTTTSHDTAYDGLNTQHTTIQANRPPSATDSDEIFFGPGAAGGGGITREVEFSVQEEDAGESASGEAGWERDLERGVEVGRARKNIRRRVQRSGFRGLDAFYADMGGITVQPLSWKSFPVNPKQLFYLVDHAYMPCPQIPPEDIQTRGQADTLSSDATGHFLPQHPTNISETPSNNQTSTIASLLDMAVSIEYLCATMSYKLFCAFATTSTPFERAAFLAWFAFDVAFAAVAVWYAYLKQERLSVALRPAGGVLLELGAFAVLARIWPDEKEQLTGLPMMFALQLPVHWGGLWVLVREKSAKGHSLKMWITRYIACIFICAVFVWRWLNVPGNWSYINSPYNWWIMGLTLLPETIFPFVYMRVLKMQEARETSPAVTSPTATSPVPTVTSPAVTSPTEEKKKQPQPSETSKINAWRTLAHTLPVEYKQAAKSGVTNVAPKQDSPPASTFKETFKQTSSGRLGARRKVQKTEYTVHNQDGSHQKEGPGEGKKKV